MLDTANNPEPHENEKYYEVPQLSELNLFQKICTGIMVFFAAFLFGFIIYISFTWNKLRINEYT